MKIENLTMGATLAIPLLAFLAPTVRGQQVGQCPNVTAILQAGNEAKWVVSPGGPSCDDFSFSYGNFHWNNQGTQQCPAIIYQPECKTQMASIGFYTKEITKPVIGWMFECECVSNLLGICLDSECQSGGPVTLDTKLCHEGLYCVTRYVVPSGPGPTTGAPAPTNPGPVTGAPGGFGGPQP